VDTVIEAIQMGIPLARCELIDEVQMKASIAFAGLEEFEPRPALFLEFHGSEQEVRQQAEQVGVIARAHGGDELRWAIRPEERSRLWKARHDAHYAAQALAPGKKGIVTDVCVPISRLTECIVQTKADIAASGLIAPVFGHVGDGNYHTEIFCDPDDPGEVARGRALAERMVERALAAGGTCSGEHGVGSGKIAYLQAEHGDGVETMRRIKHALDPRGILNPGKVLPTL
jgi:D-lactate dehydrogenase (cytochrome)